MQTFNIYTPENANLSSSRLLATINDQLGFVPNVFAVIASSPPALKAFMALNEQFANTAFNPTCREIIQIAVSIENQCNYCIAGHTTFAEMQHVSPEIIAALRNNQPIEDSKLEALNQFTRSIVRNKGMVSNQEIQQFLDLGYTTTQVIEIILGICVKAFSNLANNLIGTPLDEVFSEHAWTTQARQT